MANSLVGLVGILLLGLIPAFIAKKKGRNFWGWWLFGIILFIIALIAAIVIKPTEEAEERRKLANGYKRCPYCTELVRNEAKICSKCGKEI